MILNKSVAACIPARYASTRLPGKPLLDINGVPMVVAVAARCHQLSNVDQVVVLTDDELIYRVVTEAGFDAVVTSQSHQSGTDRLTEYSIKNQFDYYINVQGDEPFFNIAEVNELITTTIEKNAEIGTILVPINDAAKLFDESRVKVVMNKSGEALYFSRQAIPAQRGLPYRKWLEKGTYYQHIGIYTFSNQALSQIKTMKLSTLEQYEQLEQLRWIENGMKIQCSIGTVATPSIDTQEDYDRLFQIN